MKSGIHPEYVECTVRCSCGNTFKTHSTKSEIQVELCNECHPFYTGQQKFVDTGGRVQRFADKFGGAAAAPVSYTHLSLWRPFLRPRRLVWTTVVAIRTSSAAQSPRASALTCCCSMT